MEVRRQGYVMKDRRVEEELGGGSKKKMIEGWKVKGEGDRKRERRRRRNQGGGGGEGLVPQLLLSCNCLN